MLAQVLRRQVHIACHFPQPSYQPERMVGFPAGRLWRLSRTGISFGQELRLVPLSFSQHRPVRQVKAQINLPVVGKRRETQNIVVSHSQAFGQRQPAFFLRGEIGQLGQPLLHYDFGRLGGLVHLLRVRREFLNSRVVQSLEPLGCHFVHLGPDQPYLAFTAQVRILMPHANAVHIKVIARTVILCVDMGIKVPVLPVDGRRRQRFSHFRFIIVAGHQEKGGRSATHHEKSFHSEACFIY